MHYEADNPTARPSRARLTPQGVAQIPQNHPGRPNVRQKGVREIPLTQGKVALVDGADYERLSRWKWRASGKRGTPESQMVWYAVRRRQKNDGPGPTPIRMHREILGAPAHLEVDHINGNGLDNRRCNLRLATRALNQRNHHRRKTRPNGLPVGVCPSTHGKRFMARIKRAGQMMGLGTYDTPEESSKAYLAARAKNIAEEEAKIASRSVLPKTATCPTVADPRRQALHLFEGSER